jgi:hypothetical protein
MGTVSVPALALVSLGETVMAAICATVATMTFERVE